MSKNYRRYSILHARAAAVRRRMGYTLRQAVYFNPDCTEAVIQKTIAECNRILSEQEGKS